MRKGISADQATVWPLLDRAEVLHLSFVDDGGPYSVPVNFARLGDTLYLHSGRKGRKAAALGSGVAVAFSAVVSLEAKTGPAACNFSYRFESVAGTGSARLVGDEKERLRGMTAINVKYGAAGLSMDNKIFTKTVLFALDLDTATARVHG
jgi:uncharacterized protein